MLPLQRDKCIKNRLQQECHGNLSSILFSGHWATKLEAPWGHFLSQLGVGVYGDVHIRSYIHEVAWSWIIQQHGIDLMIIWRFDFATMIHQSGSSGLVNRDEIYPDSQSSTGVPQAPAQKSPTHGTLVMAQILEQALCRRMLKDILLLSACSCRVLHLEFCECNLTPVTTSIQKKT